VRCNLRKRQSWRHSVLKEGQPISSGLEKNQGGRKSIKYLAKYLFRFRLSQKAERGAQRAEVGGELGAPKE